MIISCSEFLLNEARVNKQEIIEAILDILNKKPLIKTNKQSGSSSTAMPDEKGMYSIGTLKRELAKDYTALQVLSALHDLQNDKKLGLKHKAVYISNWKESIPYYFLGLSDAEAEKIKSKYEKEEKELNKETIKKRQESKTKQESKKPIKKKVTVKKTATPKKAATKRKTTKG